MQYDEMPVRDDDVHDAVPLKPVWFHILLTLAEEPAHGYAIRKRVEARTEGGLKLWPATLYGALSDLSEAGFIVEDEDGREPDDNLGRIRYRLTGAGDRVLEAETNRLDELVRAAKAARAARPGTA